MPADSSMIRTVPGANVGPAGGCGPDEGDDGVATGSPPPPDCPTTSPMPTTSTSTSTSSEMPTIQPVRPRSPEDRISVGGSTGVTGRVGASTGENCTATPGPAGVATSDQAVPLHHRTIPADPSGSGYQPGGGAG